MIHASPELRGSSESGREREATRCPLDLEALLQDILRRARQLTGSLGASLLLEDERTGGLYFAAALGDDAPKVLAKEPSRNNLADLGGARPDLVVPVTVKLIASDIDLFEFLIGDLDAGLVGFRVDLGMHLEAS